MRSRPFFVLLVLVSSSSVLTLARAHHSWPANYHVDQQIALEGVVLRYLWRNPHVFIYLEIANEEGEIEKWELEWGNTNVLTERGLSAVSIREGDHILVSGWPARSAAKRMNLQKLLRPMDGLTYPTSQLE